jgi:hypothetical protein
MINLNNYIVYFDPVEHKYTDNLATLYTSVTTKIGEYYEDFTAKAKDIAAACERIGRNPTHPKYNKYAGKTKYQILQEWKLAKLKSHDRGNERHGFIEVSVNRSNGYTKYISSRLSKGRIYTIVDVLNNNKLGIVDLNLLVKSGIKDRFPIIYYIIEDLVNRGYKIYSEVCVFSPEDGIAGLIDLLAVKDGKFIIIDWKTNIDPLVKKAGYFETGIDGKRTGKFIETNERLLPPLYHIHNSSHARYTLQLTAYTYLAELAGLTNEYNILCHIRHNNYPDDHKILDLYPEVKGKEQVDIHSIPYWKSDFELILEDSKRIRDAHTGVTLFSSCNVLIK